jgi:hypothetical protein
MEKPLTLEQATERLLEDERLRSALADDEAQVLLDWVIAALEAAAARGEALEPVVDRLRAVGRQVNDLVGERDTLTPAALADRLRRLAGRPPAGRATWLRRLLRRGDVVDRLVGSLPTLDGPALTRAVLALLPTPAGQESTASTPST